MIKLDGIKIQLRKPDIDGDGESGGLEIVTENPNLEGDVTFMKQKSEVGEAMENLDNDAIDPITKQSSIDMNSQISAIEKMSHLVVDSLVGFSFLPIPCRDMSRQSKKLSVSVLGTGRKQKVAIATGVIDKNKSYSLWDRAKNAIGGGDRE